MTIECDSITKAKQVIKTMEKIKARLIIDCFVDQNMR